MDGKDMAAEANGKVPECDVTPGEPESKLASKESFWHIDRTMLRFKIHFFLYIGGGEDPSNHTLVKILSEGDYL
ncbi:hypothetical protein CDAR_448031 [Caerostris darwini]|uniref:Uncharacterized protein n=1 Tax=Caerostris darwini TaxID=1538125 RepID=A0AAV4Q2U8_9ARAC|nr:hypothetical protein CDAR_448031 [Caerostris darwini]